MTPSCKPIERADYSGAVRAAADRGRSGIHCARSATKLYANASLGFSARRSALVGSRLASLVPAGNVYFAVPIADASAESVLAPSITNVVLRIPT